MFRSKIFIFTLACLIVLSGVIPYNADADTNMESEAISLAFLYGGTYQTYIEQLNKAGSAINAVSPNFFNLDKDGRLIDSVDPKLVKEMKRRGIKVMPFLANHWDRAVGIKALENRSQLARDLARLVEKYDLDGVNIDLENIPEQYKNELTDFVEKTAQPIRKLGKQVSISVMPETKDIQTTITRVFDYRKLGETADFLVVMAYDESWEGGPSGPVASLPWVQQVVEHLSSQVPAKKLVLGVPGYGRYWIDGKSGRGVSYKRALEIKDKFNTEIKWSNLKNVPYLEFRDSSGKLHQLWFDNSYSIRMKLNLMKSYNLGGAALWRLGLEDPAIWPIFGQYFQSLFTDMAGHWSLPYVKDLKEAGIMNGYPDGSFKPDQPLTRAEAAAAIVRLMDGEASARAGVASFSDLPADYWAYEAILSAKDKGWISGYGNGMFRPNRAMTRAELASLLLNLYPDTAKPEVSVSSSSSSSSLFRSGFPDVSAGYWAYTRINKVKGNNLMLGDPDGRFYPERAVSRAELAVVLTRLLELRKQ